MRVQGDPVEANNGVFFLHSDHLGSASLTTNASGAATARQLYDAWGNIRASASSGTMPTDIGYTGQRLDTSTGLMYYRARYYAQGLGRFVSADTIVPSPADPQSLNRYTYVRNSPLNRIDPSGHVDCDKLLSGDVCQRTTAIENRVADSGKSPQVLSNQILNESVPPNNIGGIEGIDMSRVKIYIPLEDSPLEMYGIGCVRASRQFCTTIRTINITGGNILEMFRTLKEGLKAGTTMDNFADAAAWASIEKAIGFPVSVLAALAPTSEEQYDNLFDQYMAYQRTLGRAMGEGFYEGFYMPPVKVTFIDNLFYGTSVMAVPVWAQSNNSAVFLSDPYTGAGLPPIIIDTYISRNLQQALDDLLSQ